MIKISVEEKYWMKGDGEKEKVHTERLTFQCK